MSAARCVGAVSRGPGCPHGLRTNEGHRTCAPLLPRRHWILGWISHRHHRAPHRHTCVLPRRGQLLARLRGARGVAGWRSQRILGHVRASLAWCLVYALLSGARMWIGTICEWRMTGSMMMGYSAGRGPVQRCGMTGLTHTFLSPLTCSALSIS